MKTVLKSVHFQKILEPFFSRQTMGYLELQAPNMVGNHPPFLPFSFLDFCLLQHGRRTTSKTMNSRPYQGARGLMLLPQVIAPSTLHPDLHPPPPDLHQLPPTFRQPRLEGPPIALSSPCQVQGCDLQNTQIHIYQYFIIINSHPVLVSLQGLGFYLKLKLFFT